MKRLLISYKFWFVAYVLMVITIMGSFFSFRSWVEKTYGSDSAQVEWDKWREDVKNQPDSAPVKRREPKSEQPPASALLFDYFWTCVTIALVLSSVLFGAFMFITRGAMISPGTIQDG